MSANTNLKYVVHNGERIFGMGDTLMGAVVDAREWSESVIYADLVTPTAPRTSGWQWMRATPALMSMIESGTNDRWSCEWVRGEPVADAR